MDERTKDALALLGADKLSFTAAYRAVEPELLALPESACLPVNLDVQKTAMTVLGALPLALPLRARILEELPKFEIGWLDRLETRARAAWHAQTLWDIAPGPPPPVQALADEAVARRRVLIADVRMMIKHGLLRRECLDNLAGGSGYRTIAKDLTLGVEILRTNQERVKERSSLRLAELHDLELLADRLVQAAAVREHVETALREAQLNRKRAFTLMVRGYEKVCVAATYLYDVNGDRSPLPSLWNGRGGPGKRAEAAPAPVPLPDAGTSESGSDERASALSDGRTGVR
jgi:hypothetical protein